MHEQTLNLIENSLTTYITRLLPNKLQKENEKLGIKINCYGNIKSICLITSVWDGRETDYNERRIINTHPIQQTIVYKTIDIKFPI